MTYNTPELLLIGAAQTLVLETSPWDTHPKVDSHGELCNLIDQEDATSDEYNPIAGW